MKHYAVEYRMYDADKVHMVALPAKNKWDAYDKATYEVIPEIEGYTPYSAWVVSVTYNNGNCHRFNTSEGNPVGDY